MNSLLILNVGGLSLLFVGNLLITDALGRWGGKNLKSMKIGNAIQAIGFMISLLAIFLAV